MASKSLPLSGCVLYSSKFTHDIPQSCSARPLKYKTWTSENLERACQAVESGLSLRQAAEEYQIPKSTIQDHVSGKVLSGSKSGQKYLTDEEEEELVTFLLETAKIGFPRTRKEVISIVQATVDRKGRNVTVSSGWWEGFRKRHSELSLRITEQIANNRASACTPDVLSNYFDILEQTIQENDLVSKPTQLFNCDETGMPLDPKPPKGVTAKGVKHPRAITTGNKTQITVLASCNAAGYCMPPFVIFDRKCLKQAMVDGEVPGTMYGLSESGWINSELFDLWFVHHFLPYAPTVRPILLLLDGHSSHYNPSVINKAAEEKVIIFCLPPHSSHETQPLDKGPFGPLKSSWRQVCRKFLVDNPGKVVTRFTFSKLFSEAWACAMTMKNIQAGFKYTGIYPLNRDAIVPSRKDATSTLAQRTGLKFIPLYSPARRYRPPITQEAVFTEEEESRFQKRFQEGYDITSDDRYNQWKKKHQSSNDGSGFVDQELDLSSQFSHNDTVANDANTRMFYQYPHYPPDTRYPYYPQDTLPYFPFFVPAFDPRFQSCPSTASAESNTYTFVCHPPEQPLQSAVLQKSSIFSKILEEERSLPFCKLPVIPQKKSGKVLTSAENRMAIEEKEKRKLEEMRRKEEKKEKRKSSCSKKSCTGSAPISSSQSTSNDPTEGCSLFTMPEELENSLNEGAAGISKSPIASSIQSRTHSRSQKSTTVKSPIASSTQSQTRSQSQKATTVKSLIASSTQSRTRSWSQKATSIKSPIASSTQSQTRSRSQKTTTVKSPIASSTRLGTCSQSQKATTVKSPIASSTRLGICSQSQKATTIESPITSSTQSRTRFRSQKTTTVKSPIASSTQSQTRSRSQKTTTVKSPIASSTRLGTCSQSQKATTVKSPIASSTQSRTRSWSQKATSIKSPIASSTQSQTRSRSQKTTTVKSPIASSTRLGTCSQSQKATTVKSPIASSTMLGTCSQSQKATTVESPITSSIQSRTHSRSQKATTVKSPISSGTQSRKLSQSQKATSVKSSIAPSTQSLTHSQFQTSSEFQKTTIVESPIEKYCICRQEEFGRMIYCDNANCSIGWWHFECANIKRKPRGTWYCSLCDNASKLDEPNS